MVADQLTEIRKRIDALDKRIVELLNQRAALSLEVGRVKAATSAAVFRPSREKEILTRLTRLNRGPMPEEHLRSIYREIFSSSRALQRRLVKTCPNSEDLPVHQLDLEHLGRSADSAPQTTPREVFLAVDSRKDDLDAIAQKNSVQSNRTVPYHVCTAGLLPHGRKGA